MEENFKSSVLQMLGKNIKQIRLLRGLSQESLASQLQKSVNFVSLLENGKTGFSVDTLISLCSALKVDTNSLFAGIISPINATQNDYINNALSLFEDKDKAIVNDLISYIINSKN